MEMRFWGYTFPLPDNSVWSSPPWSRWQRFGVSATNGVPWTARPVSLQVCDICRSVWAPEPFIDFLTPVAKTPMSILRFMTTRAWSTLQSCSGDSGQWLPLIIRWLSSSLRRGRSSEASQRLETNKWWKHIPITMLTILDATDVVCE